MPQLHILNHYANGGYILQNNQIIYISSTDLLGALPLDDVLIEMISTSITDETRLILKEHWHDGNLPDIIGCGRIQTIITRHPQHQQIVGILKIKSSTIYGLGNNGGQYYLFSPCNPHYPSMNVISRVKVNQYKNHIYIVAKFQSWDDKRVYAKGSCDNLIGEIGLIENEITARLWTHQLVQPTQNQLIRKTLPTLKPTDVANRIDFQDQYVFSIDPPNCQDVDDAIHITQTPDGYTLGIHIADVSAYIQAGSVLDTYAKLRMTSIYLPNDIHHMLPIELSTNQCSLLANQSRLTLSLILNLNFEGQITNFQFVPATIRNRRQMTYEQVEVLLTGDPLTEMGQRVHLLFDVINKINQTQTYFKTSTIYSYETAPKAHLIVETCMVLANVLCAEKLVSMYGNAILRIHEVNRQSDLDTATDVLNQSNYEHSTCSDITRYLYMTSQNSAQYHSFNHLNQNQIPIQHWGLNAKYYTHFTSPIRRYIDLVNHRLLKGDTSDLINLEIISEHANQINQKIKRLIRDVAFLKLIDTLETNYLTHPITETQGIIVALSPNQTSVRIKLYFPQYQLTQSYVVCHSQIQHLYQIQRSPTQIILTESKSGNVQRYSLFQTLLIQFTPIPNADQFTQKLKMNQVELQFADI